MSERRMRLHHRLDRSSYAWALVVVCWILLRLTPNPRDFHSGWATFRGGVVLIAVVCSCIVLWSGIKIVWHWFRQ